MKKFIYLLAILATTANAQTIKTLGYDTTNGRVSYSGTNALTFTNSLQFATNARAATRTNLGLGTAATNASTDFQPASANLTNLASNNAINLTNFPALLLQTNGSAAGLTSFPTFNQNTTGTASNVTGVVAITNGGTGTNSQGGARTNLGLGGSASVTFSNLQLSGSGSLAIGGMNLTAPDSGLDLRFSRTGTTEMELKTNGLILHVGSYSFSGGNTNGASTTRTNLSLGATWLTNTSVINFRTAIGLGATNFPTFRGLEILDGGDEMQISGGSINSVSFGGALGFEEQQLTQDGATVFAWDTNSFAVTPAATFSTNVTVSGTFVFASSSVPTSITNAGVKGQLAYTNNYLYICISNNTWRRVQLGTW